jgi:hypothetical protein
VCHTAHQSRVVERGLVTCIPPTYVFVLEIKRRVQVLHGPTPSYTKHNVAAPSIPTRIYRGIWTGQPSAYELSLLSHGISEWVLMGQQICAWMQGQHCGRYVGGDGRLDPRGGGRLSTGNGVAAAPVTLCAVVVMGLTPLPPLSLMG